MGLSSPATIWYICYMQYRRPSPQDIYYPDPKKNDHDRLVLISREMHALIAERLRSNPQFIEAAKERVKRWMNLSIERGSQPSMVLREWDAILSEKSISQIAQLLLSQTEDADRLRSSAPFCGVISEEERLAFFKAHAPMAA